LYYGESYSTSTLSCIFNKGYTVSAVVSISNSIGEDEPTDIVQLIANIRNAGMNV
jgi:hypothetical protein